MSGWIWALLVLGGATILLGGAALGYVIWQMSRLPALHPARFVRQGGRRPGQRVVVVLGASLVHGRVGVSFVDQLAAQFPPPGTVFVNAGINGDTSYHARQRLDSVIACAPDDLIILVGTNDVTCTLYPDNWRMYRGAKQLPGPPTIEGYRDNIRAIVREGQARTEARIALCALPVLGEDLDSLPNRRVREFNAVLAEVAAEEQVVYLPVYDDAATFLAARQAAPGRAATGAARDGLRLGFLANVQHYLLGQSFDAIAHRRGLLLTTDLIHCNGAGAAIIARRMAEFLAGGA